MAKAPPSASILFHPKAKKKPGAGAADKGSPSSGTTSPRKPKVPRPPPQPDADADSATTSLPDGPYTEFNLVSSALNGWKYDVMKFDSRKPVDILKWETPVKLNRKELRRPEGSANDSDTQVKAVGPMVGPDGKPVIGMDGRVVMVDAEGKPIHSATNGKDKGKDKGVGAVGGKKKFQPKKTKQVYKIPEATRQLRKEERYPWVMEDSTGSEVWVGKMEEVVKAETHAFFMPASNNTFKFVPAHRWYKFHKRPNYHIPDLEEAESLMAMRQKNKDPERWLLHNRNGQGPSAATSAIFKAESDVGDGPVRALSGQSLGPGGRRLRTVVNGSDTLFGDDDDDDAANRRRRKRDLGADADYDEVPYQEDFADDEEKMEPEQDDDEVAKEMEERLQREYMSANKQRDGYIDESESEDESQLTGAGKAIKKLMTKLEKNDAYDDDDEGNPYATSEEEEEEEETVVSNEPAVQSHLTPSQNSRAGSQAPAQPPAPTPAPPASGPPAPPSASNSRATSPVPSHGGHSVVAKRATSPKAPKPKPLAVNGSRAGSPLAQATALSTPTGTYGDAGRAASPSASSPKFATNGSKPSNKRKATEEPDTAASAPSPTASTNGGPPKAKKRKAAVPALGPDGQPVELQEQMVIDWLRNTPNAKTRDCISYFTPYLRDEEKKAKFTALIREVAQLKGGILVLRSAYRNAGGKAAAPASAPAPMDTK